MSASQHLKSLTALRFLFFLCVFFSHYVINGKRVLPNAGSFAVVFFFMLSGFSLCLGYGNRVEMVEYGSFIKRRLLRLWPMQAVTTLLRAIPILLIPLVLGRFDLKDLMSFILKFFFLEAWIPDKQIIFNFNSCAWYLSPLVFCYFLFPFLYKLISRVRVSRIIAAIVGYILVYIGFVFIIPPERQQVFLYAAPYFRIFDFAIGVVLFRLYRTSTWRLRFNERLGWGLLCLIALIAWLPLKSWPDVLKMASVYWIPAALVIVGFSVIERTNEVRILGWKWFQVFGSAS